MKNIIFFDRDDTTIELDASAMSKALQYLPTPGYVCFCFE
jgi:hypothetical protein